MTEECVFCSIAEGKTDAELLHEDEQAVAFADKTPQASVHLLLISKTHYAAVTDVPADDPLLSHLVTVARDIGNQRSPEGFRLVINTGIQADVPHLHVHVLGGPKRLSLT
nr:HIT domain-containing protein [bacterium]